MTAWEISLVTSLISNFQCSATFRPSRNVAGEPGIEPGYSDPKSDGLPLADSPESWHSPARHPTILRLSAARGRTVTLMDPRDHRRRISDAVTADAASIGRGPMSEGTWRADDPHRGAAFTSADVRLSQATVNGSFGTRPPSLSPSSGRAARGLLEVPAGHQGRVIRPDNLDEPVG